MSENTARFGLVVDASGAQQQIKLTTEQLKALANGGKEAAAAIKGLNDGPVREIPREWQPAQRNVHALTDAIRRMREAAMRADDGRLAEKMRQWQHQSQATARGLDGIAQSMARMRTASAAAGDQRMAGMIGAADPFQKMGESAAKAAPGIDRLRGPLTQIAISASGIPGPLGRVASVLSQFAFGGALTVGVMAGIAAIGIAWEKATEKSRKAREEWEKQLDLLQKLRREQELGVPGEAGAAVRAGRARLGAIGAEIVALDTDPRQTRRMRDRRNELAAEYTRVALAVQAGEIEVTRLLGDAEAERARLRQQAIDKRIAEVRRETELVARELAEQSRLAKEYAREFIALAEAAGFGRQLIRAAVGDTSKFGYQPSPMGIPLSTLEDIEKRIAAGKLPKTAEQKAAEKVQAGQHIGQYGIGVASQAPGIGGAISGVGAGLMAGNPWLAAAQGVTGLVEGLFSMGEASRRAAEHSRALTMALQSWIDAAEFELGRIGAGEKAARDTARDAATSRGLLFGSGPLSAEEAQRKLERWMSLPGMSEEQRAKAQAELDRINALEKDLTEFRRREADEMERLATAYRNAPRGFFVEAYLSAAGRPSQNSGHDTVTGPVGTMPTDPISRIPPQIIVSEGAIVVNGVNDPVQAAQLVVQGLTLIGSASGSGAGSRSRTLDLM